MRQVRLGVFEEGKELDMTKCSMEGEDCKEKKQGQNGFYQPTQVVTCSMNNAGLTMGNCSTGLGRMDRKSISLPPRWLRPEPHAHVRGAEKKPQGNEEEKTETL